MFDISSFSLIEFLLGVRFDTLYDVNDLLERSSDQLFMEAYVSNKQRVYVNLFFF